MSSYATEFIGSNQTKLQAQGIKGIFSDSNNIFEWHKSKDIKKKGLFPKFHLILIFRLQVMHDYVHFSTAP